MARPICSGEPVSLHGHGKPVVSAAFSPDSRRIVTASGDKTARVWPVDRGGEAVVLRGHGSTVWSAAFSPDGRRVVTASDQMARVWSADGFGEPVILRGDSAVMSAAFSPDGTRVVTASYDGTVRVWAIGGRLLQALIRASTTTCLESFGSTIWVNPTTRPRRPISAAGAASVPGAASSINAPSAPRQTKHGGRGSNA
jgi:WD40 repeat protein